MGTIIEVQVPKANLTMSEQAFAEFSRLDHLLSSYKPQSEISRLNRGEVVTLSPSTQEILELSRKFAIETKGYFDPTLGALTQEAYSWKTQNPTQPTEQKLQRARGLSGFEKWETLKNPMQLRQGLKIDLGGVGKGYAVDQVRKVFEENKVNEGLIAASGDIYCFQSCVLAVREASGETAPEVGSGHLTPGGRAISTSGRDIRSDKTGKVHHLLSPKSGMPVSHWRSLTIVAKDSNASLDAWTTALFVMPEEEALLFLSGKSEWSFLIQTTEGKIVMSENWETQFLDWSWRADQKELSIMRVQQKKKN